MAVGQAVDAFRLFTELDPDRQRMRDHFLSLTGQGPVSAAQVLGAAQ